MGLAKALGLSISSFKQRFRKVGAATDSRHHTLLHAYDLP